MRSLARAKTQKTKSGTAKRKPARARPGASRKRLAPRGPKRGGAPSEALLAADDPALAPLAGRVRELGGTPVGAYREPLSGAALLVAVLPIQAVEPTPFQRDLSPTHARRLAQKIEETGLFLDPLIVVQALDGSLWTPNGRHRLAAARFLGLRSVTALVSPDERLAFRILALNTEKAHNLKDRSLEVVRMAQALAKRQPRAREADFVAELEEPALLTLGLVYQGQPRFAGSPYFPFLRKVDRFASATLPKSLRERAGLAARLAEIDTRVKQIVDGLKQRGFRSPYLRSYVVARINPVRFHKARKGDTQPPMSLAAGLTRMAAAARKFDTATVREQDLALVAAVSSED